MRFTASSIMSTNLVYINEEEFIDVASALMKVNRIRHLPVVDSTNNLTGIISSTDVLKSLGKKIKIKSVMTSKVRIVKETTSIQKVIAH